jgi:two-component system KDP operon response regulator KdpE
VIEDDPAIGRQLERGLERAGYRVSRARDGSQALLAGPADVILLDLGLPDIDGLELCQRLRARSAAAIIAVTARSEEATRVATLDAGADDYLVKPFSIGELLARMRVALRHRGTALQPAITRYDCLGLHVDLAAHRVGLNGQPVHLTPTEFELLARLVRNAGQVVTHRQLLAEVWGPEYTEHTHYLRLYMGQLRSKLEADPADPSRLLTEPGVGYRLVEPEGRAPAA